MYFCFLFTYLKQIHCNIQNTMNSITHLCTFKRDAIRHCKRAVLPIHWFKLLIFKYFITSFGIINILFFMVRTVSVHISYTCSGLSLCRKCRRIINLSIVSKVITRVLLDRMTKAIYVKLRIEHDGFKNERLLIEQITTVRIVVEQTTWWQVPLTSALLTLRRLLMVLISNLYKTCWDTMVYPECWCIIIQKLYNGFTCRVKQAEKPTGSLSPKVLEKDDMGIPTFSVCARYRHTKNFCTFWKRHTVD